MCEEGEVRFQTPLAVNGRGPLTGGLRTLDRPECGKSIGQTHPTAIGFVRSTIGRESAALTD
jgi:hypothetical protein